MKCDSVIHAVTCKKISMYLCDPLRSLCHMDLSFLSFCHFNPITQRSRRSAKLHKGSSLRGASLFDHLIECVAMGLRDSCSYLPKILCVTSAILCDLCVIWIFCPPACARSLSARLSLASRTRYLPGGWCPAGCPEFLRCYTTRPALQ